MLVEKGYKNVIGTLEHPVHAKNIEERMKEIPSDTCVIAVDAALGKERNIGKLILNNGEIHPGRALNKNLPAVGDYSIIGIVNFNSGGSPLIVGQLLSSTRLHTVMKMATTLVESIEKAFPTETNSLLEEIN